MSYHPRYLRNRHSDTSTSPPLVLVTDSTVTATANPTDSSFVYDTQVNSAATLSFGSTIPTPVITNVVHPFPSSTSAAPSSSSSSATTSSDISVPIPLSTVVGACVGAFIGAIFLISIAVWFYRRTIGRAQLNATRRLRNPPHSSQARNGERDRPKTRKQSWDKLDEEDDKWEGQYQTKEVNSVGPMEKLTMFKKSPSVGTADKDLSANPSSYELEQHPSSQADPQSEPVPTSLTPREYVSRLDTGPPTSWGGETAVGDSFLSMSPSRVASGAMSPPLNRAIPTPPATAVEPHQWHSAEVMHFDEVAVAKSSISERSKGSTTNPFFGAQEPRRSIESRKSSNLSTGHRISAKEKGKQKATDPFDDEHEVPKFPPHLDTNPSFTSASGQHALQSLIAALDISPEAVAERLRVASMQPSFVSAETETYEEDVTTEFPLPPSNDSRAQL